jgi:quercetin dioxygenase-like cupin family protein
MSPLKALVTSIQDLNLHHMNSGSNSDGNNKILLTTKKNSSELEKAKSHIIVEIIEYIPNSVVSKTIIKKSTGNISVMSFDTGEGLTEKTSPFDTFAQIIEGKAEIVIDKISNLLVSGQGIVIPAHAPNFIKPNGRFKMILTIIKSGYE